MILVSKTNIISSKIDTTFAVTHSLWGWWQLHPATGTTWYSPPRYSPPLWLYSSLSSIASDKITPLLLYHDGPSKHYSLLWKKGTTTIITAQGGNNPENNLWIWKQLLKFLSPPPKLPYTPHTPFFFSCVNISPGFSFEVDHLCQPHCQLAQRGPHSFYTGTYTQRCRAGMQSPSPLAVQLANPWTVGQLETLNWVAKLKPQMGSTLQHHQETRI